VVTDEMMPGLRGRELAARLRAIKPDIKIILCTGYSDALSGGVDAVLFKPVDAATVAAELRRLCDVPAAS